MLCHYRLSSSLVRFGQRCGEIQVKVHANLEVDVHSQLREARQRVHQLQQRVLHLEEEQRSLQHTVQAKQIQLQEATDVDRALNDQEVYDCDSLVKSLCDSSLSENSPKPVEELKGLSRAALVRVVHDMGERMREMYQQSNNYSSNNSTNGGGSVGKPPATVDSRARALLENSTSIWSLNGDVEDDYPMDESKSERSEDSQPRTNVAMYHQRSQSDDMSVDRNQQFNATSLVTQSRRVRQLLDGITVITHGTFGNSKTKLLSLSPDLKQLVWKDILQNTSKQEDVTQYRGFTISDVKADGVVVKYEHKNKSKKMEIPRNNMQPEENRTRVQKWIGLLNSLGEAAA